MTTPSAGEALVATLRECDRGSTAIRLLNWTICPRSGLYVTQDMGTPDHARKRSAPPAHKRRVDIESPVDKDCGSQFSSGWADVAIRCARPCPQPIGRLTVEMLQTNKMVGNAVAYKALSTQRHT